MVNWKKKKKNIRVGLSDRRGWACLKKILDVCPEAD